MSDIEDRLKKIIVEHLGIEESKIKPDSLIQTDLGADSLDFADIIISSEEEFNIEIPDKEAEKLRTFGDCVAYLKSRKA